VELALREMSSAKLLSVRGGLGFVEFVTEGMAEFVGDGQIE
jgi:hypothetical protein